MTDPLSDAEKMVQQLIESKGLPPNVIALGGPRTDGLEPGVYVRNADNTFTYYTFEEWNYR